MQLTLLTLFAQRAPAAGPVSRRGPVVPSRESVAMSQLDRIAAQNLRSPAQGLGASGMLLALLGGLVVLGSASMWNRGAGNDPRTAGLTADGTPVLAVTPASPSPLPAAIERPVIAAQVAPGSIAAPAATPSAFALPAAQPARVDTAAAAAGPSADDTARRDRARQLAEARRKSAQLAQERAAVQESQRLQLAQQREAERAQQQQQQLAEQARQRAVAEQARSQTVQLALNTRRSVVDACSASGGAISRHFCSARECSKPEHQGDPVCVTLREDDLARQRASIER